MYHNAPEEYQAMAMHKRIGKFSHMVSEICEQTDSQTSQYFASLLEVK